MCGGGGCFLIVLVALFVFFLLFFNIVFLKIQPLLQIFNLCFLVFVVNFVHLKTQTSLMAWPLSPPLDSPFSPPGGLCLFSPPSLLYPTLWISVCSRQWRTRRELVTGWICLSPFHFPLLSSWPSLSTSSLSSSLCNSVNISERSRLWSTHKEVITG